jgi:outer membrane protein assembly factor BamA
MRPLRALLAAALLGGLASAQVPAAEGAPPPPGPDAPRRYVVEHVALEGLTRTKPSAVQRHLSVREGQALDEATVVASRLRLLQLGWFSRVETRVEKGSERGLVVLVFSFTERNTVVVSDLVLGSTGPQPFYGGLGLSDANFLGQGLALGGAFVYGGPPAGQPLAPSRFAVRAAFFDPDLDTGGLPLVVGLTAVALRGEELTCPDPDCNGFQGRYGDAPRVRYDRLGGELTAGIRPGPFERLLAGFRAEWLTAEQQAGAEPPGPLPSIHPGHSVITALAATYDRDTRNDLFLPMEGARLSVNVTFATPALGGDYEYARLLVQLETDHRLPWGHALRLQGAAGAVQGDAPFFDRFYAADWAYFTIGPALGRALELNFSTDSRYDAVLAMAGTEYGIPLWSASGFFHRGYLALGARWSWTAATSRSGRTPASRTPFSGEVALRLDTPVGSFNVSTGYALDIFL